MTTPFIHHKRRLKAGITVHAEIMLDLCRRWPAPGCTMAELKRLAMAEQVGSPMTLHNAIHELVERGLVVTKEAAKDKRAKRITVTPAGRGLLLRGESD